MMEEQKTVSIIGYDFQSGQSKGLYTQSLLKQSELSIDVLQSNLSIFIQNISSAFDRVASSIKNYSLDEIEINLDVSVNGGISLIGSMEAGATGGITLKFKREA